MNLSEFLLARIAEDEENIRSAVQMHEAWCYGNPQRFLAECVAKRQLVAEHGEEWRRPHRDLSPMNSYIAKGRLNGLWTALQILALPFADHPDYDETWRP